MLILDICFAYDLTLMVKKLFMRSYLIVSRPIPDLQLKPTSKSLIGRFKYFGKLKSKPIKKYSVDNCFTFTIKLSLSFNTFKIRLCISFEFRRILP
jgi:hypothetical protein